MKFKGNFAFFENTFKMFAFDPKFEVDFYNPFNLLPCRETFTFLLKSILLTFIYLLNQSCLHLVYIYLYLLSFESKNKNLRSIPFNWGFKDNLKDLFCTEQHR